MAKVGRIGPALGAAVLVWGSAACSGGSDDGQVSTDETSADAPADPGSGGGDGGEAGDEAAGEDGGEDGGEAGDQGGDGATGTAGETEQRDGTVRQTAVLARLPGRADGDCVPVGDRRDVRSGDIGAGPFEDARAQFVKQRGAGQPPVVRLYFIPASGGQQLPGLQLVVRNRDTGDRHEVKETTTSDADRWTFYDAEVPVPRPGTYEIRATSGSDSGCFLVQFGQRSR